MQAQSQPPLGGTLSAGLTLAGLRELRRLIRENQPVHEADCLYFSRLRNRQHRLRVASATEVSMMQLLHSTAVPTNGLRFYVSIRQVSVGQHATLFTLGWAGLDVDETEEVCRRVFERLRTADDIRIADGLALAQEVGDE